MRSRALQWIRRAATGGVALAVLLLLLACAGCGSGAPTAGPTSAVSGGSTTGGGGERTACFLHHAIKQDDTWHEQTVGGCWSPTGHCVTTTYNDTEHSVFIVQRDCDRGDYDCDGRPAVKPFDYKGVSAQCCEGSCCNNNADIPRPPGNNKAAKQCWRHKYTNLSDMPSEGRPGGVCTAQSRTCASIIATGWHESAAAADCADRPPLSDWCKPEDYGCKVVDKDEAATIPDLGMEGMPQKMTKVTVCCCGNNLCNGAARPAAAAAIALLAALFVTAV